MERKENEQKKDGASPILRKWTPAVYHVTQSMRERLKIGSTHYAVAENMNPGDPHGLLIALCGEDAESSNDARLIAAAPDLLDAVEAALDYMTAFGIDESEDIWPVLRNALAKATGGAT